MSKLFVVLKRGQKLDLNRICSFCHNDYSPQGRWFHLYNDDGNRTDEIICRKCYDRYRRHEYYLSHKEHEIVMNKVRQMISEQTMPCEDCGERGYRDKTDPNLFLCDHCRHERLEIGKKAKIENALFDSHNDNNDK